MSITNKKVRNNINNASVDQSGMVSDVNKSELGMTNKDRVNGTDIESRVSLGKDNKSGANKAEIKADKKASTEHITNIDNNINDSVKKM